MTFLSQVLRGILCPGFLSALVVGLLCRGIALWLGAKAGRRPVRLLWQPLTEVLHLAGKSPADGPSQAPAAVWPGLVGLASLAWATAMLPWPLWLASSELPASFLLYLSLLVVPGLARMVAAGSSASPLGALGARRQAPREIARLLPMLVAAVGLPLFTQQFVLLQEEPLTLASALVSVGTTGILLVTLPWSLWDHDRHDAPLAGLSGRTLAIYRAQEGLELAAQMGLIAVVLRASGLFPSSRDGLSLLAAFFLTTVVLAIFEARGRQVLLPEAARFYTRWVLPAAVVVAALGWWLGR